MLFCLSYIRLAAPLASSSSAAAVTATATASRVASRAKVALAAAVVGVFCFSNFAYSNAPLFRPTQLQRHFIAAPDLATRLPACTFRARPLIARSSQAQVHVGRHRRRRRNPFRLRADNYHVSLSLAAVCPLAAPAVAARRQTRASACRILPLRPIIGGGGAKGARRHLLLPIN